MRYWGVKALFVLAFLYVNTVSHAQSLEGVPVDKQVELNLPQKSDPLAKKKTPIQTPGVNGRATTKISYDGLWLVTRITDDCKSRISDFKIRVSGASISTVIGMNVKGRMLSGGQFEMNAKSQYWVIKFSGKLGKKSGLGKWLKIDTKNNTCTGSVSITRVNK